VLRLGRRFFGLRRRTDALACLCVLLAGVVWRLPFLPLGYSATDEGWLQSIGMRIADGQIPYRDFVFVQMPFSAYLEAFWIKLLGGHYTVPVERLVFSLEAAVGSVAVYVMLRSLLGWKGAVALSLVTVPFSIQLYLFPNYTYDAAIWSLLSWAVVVRTSRRRWLFVAGILAGLAGLSKAPYFALLAVWPLYGVVARVLTFGENERPFGLAETRAYLGGAVFTVCAWIVYIWAERGLRGFLHQNLILLHYSSSVQFSFVTGGVLARDALIGGAEVAGIILLAALAPRRSLMLVAMSLLSAFLVYKLLAGPVVFLVIEVAWVASIVLLFVAIVAASERWRPRLGSFFRAGWPPVWLPLLAIALEYAGQFNSSSSVYSYIGCYLSLPAALLLVQRCAHRLGPRALRLAPAVVVAAWIVVGSAVTEYQHIYLEGPVPGFTGSFQAAKLAGIRSEPARVARYDWTIAQAQRFSRPGGYVFVMPDFPGLYWLSERRNPTPTDWYYEPLSTSTTASDAIGGLSEHRPAVIFINTRTEFSTSASGDVIDYAARPDLDPIVAWVRSHYCLATVQYGVEEWLPAS
jgi:hypothetical protein